MCTIGGCEAGGKVVAKEGATWFDYSMLNLVTPWTTTNRSATRGVVPRVCEVQCEFRRAIFLTLAMAPARVGGFQWWTAPQSHPRIAVR